MEKTKIEECASNLKKLKDTWETKQMFLNGHNPLGKDISPALSLAISILELTPELVEELETTINIGLPFVSKEARELLAKAKGVIGNG